MAAAEEKAEGTTVFITGANKGIGFEFVKQYLEKGYNVVAACRRPSNPNYLNGLNELLKTNGDKLTIYSQLDVSNIDDIKQLSQEYNENKPIDILLLNAGIMLDYAIDDFDKLRSDHPFSFKPNPDKTEEEEKKREEDERKKDTDYYTLEATKQRLDDLNTRLMRTFQVNTAGPILVAQALMKSVGASTRKQMVVMSSGLGSIQDNGMGGVLSYRTSKVAVNGAFQNLSIKNKSIHTLIVEPGFVKSDLTPMNKTSEHSTAIAPNVTGMINVINNYKNIKTGSFYSYKEAPFGSTKDDNGNEIYPNGKY